MMRLCIMILSLQLIVSRIHRTIAAQLFQSNDGIGVK
jgi:hypothetical protein